MQYRKFGKLDFQVSALGFGAMRFPMAQGRIDERETARMLQYAIEQGVNYIDTAYVYHEGHSETVVGKFLKESGLRDKVKIATKQPVWLLEDENDAEKYLDEQLEKLQTDHIDFYLLHALFSERWEVIQRYKVLDWAEKAIQKGKIGHLGFSFHDSAKVFKEIVDAYDKWEFCQIQYNYAGENVQAGKEGLQYAAAKGLAVVVMEPLLGGLLAAPPPKAKTLFNKAKVAPADLALRWLWDQPEVSTVLSGMSTMRQLRLNLDSAERSGVDSLTDTERELIRNVASLQNNPIPCTKCRYCMPCPNGVDIPYNFEVYNQSAIHKNPGLGKSLYNWHIPDAFKANACVQCKICEEHCPQRISISEWMPKIHTELVF